MSLIDNPWPYTLREVAFCVCFGMVLCLYFFFVKGGCGECLKPTSS